jgi:co-chaperonin GroES (HSP10)
MKIKATNNNVLVVRDKSAENIGGLYIPDEAKKLMHRGVIKSVGSLCSDKTIKEGVIGIFNKSAGFEITEDGVIYLVLTQMDIISTK